MDEVTMDCEKCQAYQQLLGSIGALKELRNKLSIWDNGANSISAYVWHVINKMEQERNEFL